MIIYKDCLGDKQKLYQSDSSPGFVYAFAGFVTKIRFIANCIF